MGPSSINSPISMSYIDAGVLLSLAESHSAAKNFGVTDGTEVLIYGSGPMGMALSLFCGLMGGHVTQIDKIQERLEIPNVSPRRNTPSTLL